MNRIYIEGILLIQQKLNDGESVKEIAKDLCITRSRIYQIIDCYLDKKEYKSKYFLKEEIKKLIKNASK